MARGFAAGVAADKDMHTEFLHDVPTGTLPSYTVAFPWHTILGDLIPQSFPQRINTLMCWYVLVGIGLI